MKLFSSFSTLLLVCLTSVSYASDYTSGYVCQVIKQHEGASVLGINNGSQVLLLLGDSTKYNLSSYIKIDHTLHIGPARGVTIKAGGHDKDVWEVGLKSAATVVTVSEGREDLSARSKIALYVGSPKRMKAADLECQSGIGNVTKLLQAK